MKNLIPITNLTNVYGVKIDDDATEIQLTHHAVAYKSVTSNLPTDTNGFRFIEVGLGSLREFEILGYVTSTEISFDVEPFLIKSELFPLLYKEFPIVEESQPCGSKHDAFCSYLPSDVYFVNPFGEKPIWQHCRIDSLIQNDGDTYEIEAQEILFKNHLDQWQAAENAKTQKLLIIRKV